MKDNVLRPNMQAVSIRIRVIFSYREINGDNYRLRKSRVFVFENERLDDIYRKWLVGMILIFSIKIPTWRINNSVSSWKNMNMWIHC